GQLGPAAREAAPALFARLEEEGDEGIRYRVGEALVRLGPGVNGRVPAFVNLCRHPESGPPPLEVSCLRALAQTSDPELIAALKDDDHFVRRIAVQSFADSYAVGADAVPALAEALTDADLLIRADAARALERTTTP